MARGWKSFLFFLVMLLMVAGGMPAYQATANEGILTEVPEGYIGIYTVEDLNDIRSNLTGKYILMEDLDLTAATAEGGEFYRDGAGWEPIGTDPEPFRGIFDGNGYSIKGLKAHPKATNSYTYAGLFGYTFYAEMRNINLENVDILATNTSTISNSSYAFAGGLAAYAHNVKIENVTVSGNVDGQSQYYGISGGVVGVVYTDSSYTESTLLNVTNQATVKAKSDAGGIAGDTLSTRITNATNKGAVQGERRIGGIVGSARTQTYMEDVTNHGAITITGSGTGGGISGTLHVFSYIKNALNDGDVTSSSPSVRTGGITGTLNNVTIMDSQNKGKVTNTGENSDGGGIAGYSYNRSTITRVSNAGEVQSTSNAGGIIGSSNSTNITETYNAAKVGGASFSGGIAGYLNDSTVKNSFNYESISALNGAGGIVGRGTSATTIMNSYNIGSVQASSTVGGIAGEFNGAISDSYFIDNIADGVGTGSEVEGARKTNQELQDISTYPNFDFTDTWKIGTHASYKYPELVRVTFEGEEKLNYLKLITPPDKTTYLQGEQLNLSGTTLHAITNHGKESNIPLTPEMTSGFQPDTPGTQTVTITYEGMTTSFSVNVIATYNVTFKDWDGTILKEEVVQTGKAATAPPQPERAGYKFIGWDQDFSTITSHTTIAANYIKIPDTPANVKVTVVDFDKITVTFDKVNEAHGYEVYIGETPDDFSTFLVDPSLSKKEFDGLAPDKTYYFYVRSYLQNGQDRVYSAPTTQYSGQTALKTISTLQTEATTYNKIKLSWNQVDSAHGYRVYRSTSENGAYSRVATISSNSTLEYTNTGLLTGKTYYYKVRTYRVEGDKTIFGAYSEVKSEKTSLGKVDGLSVASADYNKLKASWNQVSGASGYEIYRATSKTGSYYKVGTVTSGSTKTFTNSVQKTGKNYYYKVRAYRMVNDQKVYGSFSDIKSGKTILAVPASFNVVKKNNTTATLTWNKVSGASGYRIYRSTSKTGTYTRVASITSGNTVKYDNTNLVKGKTYYYKIRAYRVVDGNNVYSAYSEPVRLN
ncbi:bacterial Ig-like domain-containing protein [Bacillus sp. RO1]|uniref:bacterial Ig-like domain-containing protein n=1 Tax=Bacillus sp. RO1 TaxID=2722703 RepID=UPI001457117D|nr:bacterial Ig-like domain-containing protein [Bacillus sp. RO1]NLP51855.1 hypothetical protein [Bacillus sp. RO1]